MSIQKQYQWGGLNLRQSDLVVDKTAATDLKNVGLNYAGELNKRTGFHIDTEMPAVLFHQTNILCVADVSNSLDGTYFVMNDTLVTTVAFWIDITGGGAPATGATRDIPVTTVVTNMSAHQVASQLRLAIDADAEFDVPNEALNDEIEAFLTGFPSPVAVGDTVDGTPGTGFTFINIEAGDPKRILHLSTYNQKNELISMGADGLYVKSNGTFTSIPQDQVDPMFTIWRNKVSTIEISGSLYVGDSEGDNHVYKYDGIYFYRAGMPKFVPDSTSTPQAPGLPGPNYYYRSYYTFIDANQNIVNGDFAELKYLQADTPTLIYSSLSDTAFNGRGFTATGAQVGFPKFNTDGIAEITITNNTIPLVSPEEKLLAIGDVVFMNTFRDGPVTQTTDPEYYGLQKVVVVAITANANPADDVVTIDISELVPNTFISDNIIREGNAVDVSVAMSATNLFVNLFFSEDEFFNYELYDEENRYGPIMVSQATPLNSFVTTVADQALSAVDDPIFMDDIYDTTIRKAEIPKLKYLTSYQNALVGGNVTYPDTPPRLGDQNQVVWSDFSIGGSLESFAPFDFVEIGLSNSKEVTGVFGAQDSIVIFKTDRVYYFNGTLFAGEFKIRESLSEAIGCVANNSIIEVEDGAIFMSQQGIYHVMGGNKPAEISDANEPLFQSGQINLAASVSVLDPVNEHIMMFLEGVGLVPNRIIFYDYYFKQWFLIEDVPMSGPMVFYNSEIYLAGGGIVRKSEPNDYRDEITVGVFENVSASYATGWLDLDSASLRKKFVNLIMFSVDRLRDFRGNLPPPPNFTLDIKTQVDWVPTDKELFTMDFTDEVRADDHKLAITQNKSLRFIFENDENVNILLTGYQFEWQGTQIKPKMVR